MPGVHNLFYAPYLETEQPTLPQMSHTNREPPRNFSSHQAEDSRRGFDFRTPIFSATPPPDNDMASDTEPQQGLSAWTEVPQSNTNPPDVIDLTAETDSPPQPTSSLRTRPRVRRRSTPSRARQPRRRGPRYDRDILIEYVDLLDDDQQGSSRTTDAIADSDENSEVEFLSARTRTPPPAPPVAERIDLSNDERASMGIVPDFIRMVNQRLGWNTNAWRTDGLQPPPAAAQEPIRTAAARMIRPLGGFATRFSQPDIHFGVGETVNNMGGMPGPMDYEQQGFQLTNVVQRPQASDYKAPDPLPKGFTRIAKDEDVVVCPNCGNELGIGQKLLKRQVWVARACGHVRNPCLFLTFYSC